MSSESEKKKESESGGWVVLLALSPVIIVLAIVGGIFLVPHFHGATPAQLEAESLSKTPKQLASDLPSTEVHGDTVRVEFKIGSAGPYERADFTWSSGFKDAPTSMRLRVEHGEHDKAAVVAALGRHFHNLKGGDHRWGAVRIRAYGDDGDIQFDVDHTIDNKVNPLFDRQVEAAKEVALNAAFNLPVRVSEKDIADLLGAGYPLAQIETIDLTTPIENAATTLKSQFPAVVVRDSTSFDLPLDHPLVSKLRLRWANQAGGHLKSFEITSNDSTYPPSRQTLEACLEKKVGPPRVTVTDYAAGHKTYSFLFGGTAFSLELDERSMSISSVQRTVDGAAFVTLFQALDGCRETSEAGARTK